MDVGLQVTATAAGARLAVRVIPRSPRDAVDGIREGRLVLRIAAAPVDDRANAAAILVLARALDVPRAAIRLVSGRRARNKVFEISGVTADGLKQKWGQ